jgi:hypothetical protein
MAAAIQTRGADAFSYAVRGKAPDTTAKVASTRTVSSCITVSRGNSSSATTLGRLVRFKDANRHFSFSFMENASSRFALGAAAGAIQRFGRAVNLGVAFAAVQTLTSGIYITANGAVFHADRVRENRDVNRFEATSDGTVRL